MKKMISLLLVLIMVLSMVPMSAMAIKIPAVDNVEIQEGKPNKETQADKNKPTPEIFEPKPLNPSTVPYHPSVNDHEKLSWNCNTKYHWKECACGARLGEELHVDPLETENDYCKCGYHFSSNADLVTLWIKGCPGIKYFDKNKTEYKLNAYTYKDVKEIKISTRTHDSEATVELPEDLTLKEGENKFEIKVHAENKKVTKVYTVIINKEAAK